MKKNIGIVGCGTIGSFIAKAIDKELKPFAKIAALCDIDNEHAMNLRDLLSKKPPIVPLNKLIDKSDLVVEAASGEFSFHLAKKALLKKKDVMVMSIGGLLGKSKSLFELAGKVKARIILPSGAICGLDGIKSAATGLIRKITLTTRKPPKGLRGAPYIVVNRIDLDAITGERVLFEGTAKAAVQAFPKNINVAALLSIAGIGAKKTIVKIVTSPEYKANTHEVEVEGDFGKLLTRTENVPSPQNPKTSFLASLSAVATLKQYLDDSVKIGT